MAKKKVDKQELANKFTRTVMQEIGLEIGDQNSVIDQDTGATLQFNGKNLKCGHGDQPPRIHLSDSLLNPMGDLRQMKNLFSYYIKKEEQEQSDRTPGMFFQAPTTSDKEKNSVVFQYTDNTGTLKEIQSKEYYNEAICYADIMLQYNGEPNVDLEEFDFPLEAATKKKGRP